MSEQGIRSEYQQGVLTLTIHRPAAHNALNTPCLQQLVTYLEQAEQDPHIRAIVITGSPRLFAAGADLRELQQHTVASAMADIRPILWQRIDAVSKPIICAVNGFALGAGCELALAADIVICGNSARFGLPEITLGLIPGAGGTQRLIRCVGKSLASQMIFSGEPIDAQRALQAGLVSEICQDSQTLERAQQLAKRIGGQAPLALQAAKNALKQSQETPLSSGLSVERQMFVALADTEDRREGIDAFFAKRPPHFTGH